MNQPIKTCATCAFSIAAQDADGKINFQARVCRKNPPTPVVVPTPNGPGMRNLWPIMSTGDYCFSHAAAEFEVPLPGEHRPEQEKPQ